MNRIEDASPQEPRLELEAVKRVNFASAQNNLPVIRTLRARNPSGEIYRDLKLIVSATPPIIREKIWTIDSLAPGEVCEIEDLDFSIDSGMLSGLDETERGGLRLTLENGCGTLAEEHVELELLARDHWGGLDDMDRLLAAYVSPNDPTVAFILKEASRLLERSGQNGSMEGYQSDDPRRVWMIAGAIWSAATGLGLTYANPPASFERAGQKIRFPRRIRSEGLATCLDTSLLLAAAWEQAGLNPAVLFAEGHAFAGVWLTSKDFGYVTEPDVVSVRKAVQSKEFVAVETTYLTKRPTIGFEEAVATGRLRLGEEREHEFLGAIDIARSRSARIRPLASHAQTAEEEHDATSESLPAELPEPLDLGLLPGELAEKEPDTARGRIGRWQSKLLDLSLRNRLLNFKETKQTVPCMVPDLGRFEDALAAGSSFRAYPLREEDPVGERQVSLEEKRRIIDGTVGKAYEQGQMTVDLDKKDMDNRLLTLFRRAKSDLQEGGTNTLFLAAGFLRWQREGDKRHYRAPLVLVPIKLERRSARSEFKIRHHEDEVRFNATLLEFLKRDFELALPELEGDLPRDESGIDLPKIFQTMRARVRDVPGFEVVEDIAISTFSFSKHLMWKDLVDRTSDLRNNRLVAYLVDRPEEIFDAGHGEQIDPSELDRRIEPKDLVTPLPADSSQLAAVQAAVEGRDYVLIGPPGTGKSQTIANIICHCLAHGRTVLFVAEKAAALDVVHRRLESHGLGEAVLELHSNKTDRKLVLNQLGRGWDRASGQNRSDWIEVNRKLKIERDKLNLYVEALHAEGRQGFSIFEAIGWIAAEPRGVALAFADKDAHDPESFRDLESVAENIERSRAAIADAPPMPIIAQTDYSHAWEAAIVPLAKELRVAAERINSVGESLASELGLGPAPAMPALRVGILDRLSERCADDAEDLRDVPDLLTRDLRAALAAFSGRVSGFEHSKRQLSASYSEDEILRMDIDRLDYDWRSANAAFWPLSMFLRQPVRKMLRSYAKSGKADPATDLPALRDMRRLLESLGVDPILPLSGEDRSVSLAERVVEQAITLRSALEDADVSVADRANFDSVRAQLLASAEGQAANAMRDWRLARNEFAVRLSEFAKENGHVPEDMGMGDLVREIDVVLDNADRLLDWTRWREARSRADARGLGPLADLLEAGELDVDAVSAFRRAYARWWLPLALDASEPLRRFAHWEHEEVIRAFRDLDARAEEIAPDEVLRRIMHDLPEKDGVPRNSELGMLRHQLGLQRPSMAVRKLLGNLTESFPKLAPCVLMSPLSIAQYLPAGQAAFDMVIFDEASQITTWDAVGAIARARQSIIVGDPKQLPPTNFFGRSDDEGDEYDDGEPFVRDMQSILDEVATAGVPIRRLDWHYRSRDEALIAFSNHHYYDDRLVTFPAPATGSEALLLHKIDGIYTRGGSRTNENEAKAIVAMIEKRLSQWLEWPEEERLTLGAITFNIQQQELILNLLDAMRRRRSELEWFFDDAREEPVIVKNLENIQGDERDVMLFSITFGPDAAGKLSMAFGAINQEGGEKRLNVAVTRARREMHVFSSISHEQIDLSRSRATGVRHLKTFLDYAERGAVALPATPKDSVGFAENPFEEAVAEAFRSKGWEVRTQIGVTGYRIDLGIINPDKGGAYLAGIECDGATYHGSATARDRDKIRQAVLEGLGWTILRIWSTDWFRNPAAVVERLHEKLQKLLADDRDATARVATNGASVSGNPDRSRSAPMIEHPKSTEMGRAQVDTSPDERDLIYAGGKFATGTFDQASVEHPEFSRKETDGTDSAGSDMRNFATDDKNRGSVVDPSAFFEDSYMSTLNSLIDRVLDEKAPMTLESLAREIARLHGWQRTGRRISERVKVAAKRADLRREGQQLFVWPEGRYSERVPYRGLGDRSIEEISRNEIASVLDHMDDAIARSDDPELDLARTLGIARLTGSAREHLSSVIEWHRRGSG